ncbi:MAG TPA: glycosyltransferase family 1 protein [Chryseosolibacter sp.]|nr:glycosyltransferase family 1 protein [Chryseosolibacter sp.]
MKIGFDAKRIFANFTGLGNYSRFVVDALTTCYEEHHYYLYSPSKRSHPEVDAITSRPNVAVVSPQGLFSKPVFSALWRTWAMSGHSSVSDLSIFHGLSQELPLGLPTSVRKIVTVHDLIFLRYPEFYNRLDAAIYLKKVKNACAAADKIIAISQQTASDIVSFLNADTNKMAVVYQGCHPQFRQQCSPDLIKFVRAKYDLPAQYILQVGTIEPRKNLELLVRAQAEIPEGARLPAVIVGRPTAYQERMVKLIDALGLAPWFRFIHHAAFADLPAIYQGANVFVYPSFFEGFGIPIVEAIASGVPVITSSGSCCSEAGGPDSEYVDAASPEHLAHSLQVVISDEKRRLEMVSRSKAFIERFEPARIAASLMREYQSVL